MHTEQVNSAASTEQKLDSIDPALLAELTRALLPYLGPYSITTVKRSARSTDIPTDLIRQIANHIDDVAKRELFMKAALRIASEFEERARDAANSSNGVSGGSAGDGTAGGAASQPATGGRPSTPVTAELAQRGEAALAPIIGPLAGVLVSRYAKASQNSREFFERLAGHLRTPEERDSFFMSVRTGNGTWRAQ
jgi:hypothetical protein